MKILKDQIAALIDIVARTSVDEISCQTCEDHIAQFIESKLDGNKITSAMRVIEKHLETCPECREELEFLRRALESHA